MFFQIQTTSRKKVPVLSNKARIKSNKLNFSSHPFRRCGKDSNLSKITISSSLVAKGSLLHNLDIFFLIIMLRGEDWLDYYILHNRGQIGNHFGSNHVLWLWNCIVTFDVSRFYQFSFKIMVNFLSLVRNVSKVILRLFSTYKLKMNWIKVLNTECEREDFFCLRRW